MSIIMTQYQYSQGPREALTNAIIDAKVRKNPTFEQINEGTGLKAEAMKA
jgi:cyanate lyase